jgi:predicted RNA-binding protein Jag
MTVENLKQRILDEISAIPEEMTQRVMRNLRERLEECLRNGGRRLIDVILKKLNGV